LASKSNSTTAASITAAIASASVAAAAASRAAAAPFSLQAVVAVDGTRPCLQADSGWHTPVDTNDFGNLRSSGGLSASLGSQVATSSSR